MRFVVFAVLFAVCAPNTIGAQSADPRVRAALDQIRTGNSWILDKQRTLCQVPAPPFKEAARSVAFRAEMVALGYAGTRTDSLGNVIAEVSGAPGPTVMLAAHLDTVFPEGTRVAVRASGTRLEGPGISDDCRGLAVVLAVARAFHDQKIAPRGRVIFIANVGEEGPGNSRGVHWLLEREFKGRVNYFISVDGAGQTVTTRAVGSHRYTFTISGPGGHSYGDFGMPSPVHALGRAIAKIDEIQVPTTPRTTFNVGVIRGGTSVNSIAMQAQMDVDMRSESAEALADVDRKIRAAVDAGIADEQKRWPNSPVRLSVRVDTVGMRPVGRQNDDAPIVRAVLAAAKEAGLAPVTASASTDANVPMSLGIPAVTIDGGGRADGAHSVSEWYDDGPDGWRGPQWALLAVLALLSADR